MFKCLVPCPAFDEVAFAVHSPAIIDTGGLLSDDAQAWLTFHPRLVRLWTWRVAVGLREPCNTHNVEAKVHSAQASSLACVLSSHVLCRCLCMCCRALGVPRERTSCQRVAVDSLFNM